ncbi:MAG TPA: STAS/SEC14 domain-containing protein [Steroidobacteraceae bacterium]|nr:STAS/SEC14 domain-containing protein [Steroidobacteraceae bacterium]
MIKILDGFPEATVAVACEGHITRQDYEKVLVPRMNEALAGHEKVRIYYEIGPSFSGFEAGAIWEDTKVGLGHLSRYERMALVTDVAWIRLAVGAFRFLMPGRLRLFGTSQANEARAWIKAAD